MAQDQGQAHRAERIAAPSCPRQDRLLCSFGLDSTRSALPGFLEVRKSLPILLWINAQPLEFGLKGCAVHSEPLRCSVGSAEPAIAQLERADNVFAFDCFQGLVAPT